METSENNLNSNDSMVISSEIRHYLLETAKWMKFLAILGFIGLGFMLVAAIVMLVLGSTFESLPAVRGGTVLYAFIFVIMAVLYYFPLKFLYQAASNFKQSIQSASQELLTSGFKNLKSLFKFVGILTIVVMSIYVVVLVGGLLIVAIVGM